MQVPINPEVMLRKIYKGSPFPAYANNSRRQAPLGFSLSFESQLKLNSLHEFAGRCRLVLSEIHKDFDDLKMDPQNPDILSNATKRLGDFCLEFDSWGFHLLYDVAFALQRILMESGYRIGSHRLCNAYSKGLAILSTLVEECEADYRKKLAVEDLLACLV